jgi:hypothetical protein
MPFGEITPRRKMQSIKWCSARCSVLQGERGKRKTPKYLNIAIVFSLGRYLGLDHLQMDATTEREVIYGINFSVGL